MEELSENSSRAGLLVDRDYEIAGWIDRVGGASVDQVRCRFGLGRSQAYLRLRVLVESGVLAKERLTLSIPLLWVPAGESIGLSRIEHLYMATELVARREGSGAVMATERELRRSRRSGEAASQALEGRLPTVCGCSRTPDAVELSRGGGLVAYELELSSKGRARRDQILGAYALSDYERVVWISPSRQIASLLRREIEEGGLSRMMEVSDGLA